MKLKYYLRGLGVGILLTTFVLSAVLGKNKTKVEMSDEEIIECAEALGMEKKNPEVNIDYDAIDESISQTPDNDNSTDKKDTSTDDKKEEYSENKNDTTSNTESEKATSEEGKTESETSENSSTKPDSDTETKPQESDNDKKDVGSIGENATEKAEDEKEPTKQESSEAEKGKEELSGNKKPDSSEKEDNNHSSDANQELVIEEKPVTKTITIRPGMTAKQVCQLLEDQGVIASADAFNLYLLDNGLTERVKSVKLEIAVNSDFKTIASMLTD